MSREEAKREQARLLADTDFGQKAVVVRHQVSNKVASQCNSGLRSLGKELIKPVNEGHNTWQYEGSASIHVYKSALLNEVIFLTQTETMQDVDEITASKAFANLKSDLQHMYSGKRQTKRSGF